MISKFMFEKKVRVENWGRCYQNIGFTVNVWVGGVILGQGQNFEVGKNLGCE